MRGPWASGTRARRARSRQSGSGGGEKGIQRTRSWFLGSSGSRGHLVLVSRASGARLVCRGREVEAPGREAELRAHSGKEGVRWS